MRCMNYGQGGFVFTENILQAFPTTKVEAKNKCAVRTDRSMIGTWYLD